MADVPQQRDGILLGLNDPLPTASKASGYIRIPYSSNKSAYGFVPVPFAVLGQSTGPQFLFLSGSHGDETESQVALTRALATLDAGDMSGRVVALPMANEPGAKLGQRNSPIDGLNLNRVYPGNMFGTPTAIIADYIERHLMSKCDIVLDLHSAGRSFKYWPCTTVIFHPDREERIRRLSVALAFGAPAILVMHSFEERNSSGAANRAGAVRIATEVSGDGAVQLIVNGLFNVLRWAGVLPPATKKAAQKPSMPEILVVHQAHYLHALFDGLFEPLVHLGDAVEAGNTVGLLHDPSRPFSAPIEIKASTPGRVVCLREVGRAERGDCLLHLAGTPDSEFMEEVKEASKSTWLQKSSQRVRRSVRKSRVK